MLAGPNPYSTWPSTDIVCGQCPPISQSSNTCLFQGHPSWRCTMRTNRHKTCTAYWTRPHAPNPNSTSPKAHGHLSNILLHACMPSKHVCLCQKCTAISIFLGIIQIWHGVAMCWRTVLAIRGPKRPFQPHLSTYSDSLSSQLSIDVLCSLWSPLFGEIQPVKEGAVLRK